MQQGGIDLLRATLEPLADAVIATGGIFVWADRASTCHVLAPNMAIVVEEAVASLSDIRNRINETIVFVEDAGELQRIYSELSTVSLS